MNNNKKDATMLISRTAQNFTKLLLRNLQLTNNDDPKTEIYCIFIEKFFHLFVLFKTFPLDKVAKFGKKQAAKIE